MNSPAEEGPFTDSKKRCGAGVLTHRQMVHSHATDKLGAQRC